MSVRKASIAAFCLLAGTGLGSGIGVGASFDSPLGTIVGVVSSNSGVGQMGASVYLYNRYERLVRRAVTNESGAFGFDALTPDTYSIRVTLSSFMPAVRQNILVQPGMRSFLSINLASVLSSIELVYNAPAQNAVMSDDWKWVLRGSMATRPVLRALPGIPGIESSRSSAAVFSNTRGLFRVSAGDGVSAESGGNQQDLGTAFALATMLGTTHQLQFSGNVGYGRTPGLPSAGFRTRLSRVGNEGFGPGLSPEVNLTMRQVYLPLRNRLGMAAGDQSGAPAIRTMSASFADRAQLSDDVQLLYGAALESVTFLDRLNYLSPFAKLSFRVDGFNQLELGYSSGLPAAEIYQNTLSPDSDLQQDLTALSLFPRISLREGRPRIQREENFEAGYQLTEGSRVFAVSTFYQRTSNAAMTSAGDLSFLGSGDVLPDLFSRSSVFNLGDYASLGVAASATQHLGKEVAFSLTYGNSGVLKPPAEEMLINSADDLRSVIRAGRQNWGAARVSVTSPWTGTRLVAGYLLTGSRILTPPHRLMTQRFSTDPGLNVQLRQPIPSLGLWSGRLEATAEMRNMLASGYIPLTTSDGRKLFLIQAPRSLRGGLSFIF